MFEFVSLNQAIHKMPFIHCHTKLRQNQKVSDSLAITVPSDGVTIVFHGPMLTEQIAAVTILACWVFIKGLFVSTCCCGLCCCEPDSDSPSKAD
jgi:hypothetical protein